MSQPPSKRRKVPQVIEISSDSDTTDGESTVQARAERHNLKRAIRLSLELAQPEYRLQSAEAESTPSPIQTNYIPALPLEDNVDAITLRDLLKDVVETWQSMTVPSTVHMRSDCSQ